MSPRFWRAAEIEPRDSSDQLLIRPAGHMQDVRHNPRGLGGVLPYISYMALTGTCGQIGYGF